MHQVKHTQHYLAFEEFRRIYRIGSIGAEALSLPALIEWEMTSYQYIDPTVKCQI